MKEIYLSNGTVLFLTNNNISYETMIDVIKDYAGDEFCNIVIKYISNLNSKIDSLEAQLLDTEKDLQSSQELYKQNRERQLKELDSILKINHYADLVYELKRFREKVEVR